MLTREQRELLAKIHGDTSDTVRAWITESVAASNSGNPWAEEQCKVFIRAYRKQGSGVRALIWLQGSDAVQLQIDE